MSDQVEEVNLEIGITKRKRDGDNRRAPRDQKARGQRGNRDNRGQRGQRDQKDRRSRSRSQQKQNDRAGNHYADDEFKNGGKNHQRGEASHNYKEKNNDIFIKERGMPHDDQSKGDGFTAVIKNMMATNRISEILQDIKIRAGNVKNMSIVAEKLNPRNLDETRIEIHVTFYTAQSRDECISQYNEANLDDQVLQCYKL